MRFLNKFKPEKAASTDPARFVLENVMVDIYQNRTVLVSTDGRMIAVVPCEVDSIHDIGLVSKEALAAARKASRPKGKKEYEVAVELNGVATVREGKATHTFDRMRDSTFPKWTDLPQLKPGVKAKFQVSLDPKRLLRLAEAIGSPNGVTLEVCEMEDRFHSDSITVRPYAENKTEFGILMPLRRQE